VFEAAHELLDVDSARFDIRGTDVISERRSVVVDAALGPSRVLAGAFDTASVTLAYEADSVSFSVSLARADLIRHDAMGALRLGEDRTDLRLDRLDLQRADVRAGLARPARVSWGERGVSVDGLELIEPDGAGRSLSASGTIPTEGQIDFRARAGGIHLAALSALWMRDDSVSGVVEGQVHFRGPVEDPSLTGELLVRDVAYRSTIADLFRADLAYDDGVASVRVDASSGGTTLLDGTVRVPMNLSPTYEGPRVLDAPLDGRITARSFPLAPLLSSPGFMEDVAGTVVGDVVLAGTPRAPRLSGRMEVEGASVLFPDFGVRQDARGTLTLDDGSVEVDLSVRSVGRSRITGTVGLEDLTDPSFDLRIRADTFQVLDRRDVRGQVSGDATFGGSWASPRLEGALAIRNANLRLDELARSRQVDDVGGRDFYQVVDTTIFVDQRLATPSFADRSTIGLDLTLGGGTWLRGRTLDAELAGQLRVTHEPGGGYGVSGELRTVRGSYRGFGRNFQVVQGSVLFAGTQSLNPVLNITTVTRIRSSEQALDIFATLEGTAEEPRVTLSSAAEPPMAEEELVSYLVFGRPSYQLGSGENAVVSGVTGAASSMALGLVANELGSALGQQIGLFDYFTISAPQEAASYGQESALRSSISATEVEFGQYLSENLFLAAVFRPLDSANSFAGGRLEWRFRDSATLELFLEDRLARSPSATFGDLGFTLEQSLGMFLAKEWTY
jgi:translocation and assembly module TamB